MPVNLNKHIIKIKILSILISMILCFTQLYSQSWSALGSGTNGSVYALNSTYGSVSIGGAFTIAGGVTAKHVAEWNRTSWIPQFGATGTDADVKALSLLGIYVGGLFYHAGGDTIFHIAQHAGNSWLRLGYGLSGNGVNTLTIDVNGSLIAGGSIWGEYYRDSLNNIAKWNGSSWVTIGSGFNNIVNALTFYNGELVAGGAFTSAGSVSVNRIAKWNGSVWQPFGSGMNLPVLALTVYNGELIAGGDFTTAGGISAKYIAKWNGSSWSSLGTGVNNGTNNVVKSFTVYRGNLIVGGFFDRAGSATANFIAKWNGSSWGTLGIGMDGPVYAMDNYKGLADSTGTSYYLYAGGEFSSAGGNNANNIARWIEIDTSVKGKTYFKNNINKSILPNSTTVDSLIAQPHDNSASFIHSVSVTIDTVNFPVDSELEFSLIHQTVTDTFIYHAGGNGSNFTGTFIDDTAPNTLIQGIAPFTGAFKPFKPLSKFNNMDPFGTWILKIYNSSTVNTGTLKAWSLNVGYGYNPIGVQPISNITPKDFKLSQNYPNPFNPNTVINFQLTVNSFTTLKIYDIIGREAATLVNEQLKPGKYRADWDAAGFSSGIYFYELTAGNFKETLKMILLK